MISKEPVLLAAILRLAGYAVAKFGLDLSLDDLMAIIVVVEALSAYWTRARVSPVNAE